MLNISRATSRISSEGDQRDRLNMAWRPVNIDIVAAAKHTTRHLKYSAVSARNLANHELKLAASGL